MIVIAKDLTGIKKILNINEIPIDDHVSGNVGSIQLQRYSIYGVLTEFSTFIKET